MRIALMIPSLALALGLASTAQTAEWSGTALSGYQGGPSLRAGVGVFDFSPDLPLGAELGLSYALVDPGDAVRARRVFIQNAQNGTPTKSGSAWGLRMDFLYPLKTSGARIALLAGPRFSMFNGHFRYVGANEEFEVSSDQWAFGLGARGVFTISKGLSLVVLAGLDYFLDAPLSGHDTVYYPDDRNENAEEDFVYRDADAAINQPKFMPTVMVGLGF